MPPRMLRMALVPLFALLAGPAVAAPPPVITHAWIRWLPGSAPLGGYFEVHNRSGKALELVGASGPAFSRIELHRSIRIHGMDKMIHLHSITIPAGVTLRFHPGGYHLMLWRQRPVAIGDDVDIRLRFADGESDVVRFHVRGPAG